MSWAWVPRPFPPMVWSQAWAAPASGICMPCMHMHAFVLICMNICTCLSTSTYACMAYACGHMNARHACTYICMHGMRAYMHA